MRQRSRSPVGRLTLGIEGPALPKDLFPRAPVAQMRFPGKGSMFLSELIGLAVLISSLETCIQQLYTCLISQKMELTGYCYKMCQRWQAELRLEGETCARGSGGM